VLQEICADFQASGAAERLHRDDAPFLERGTVRAEDQLADRAVVGGQPIDRQVAAGRGLLEQHALGAAHALQERHLALVIVVDADAEVDLFGIPVGVERFGESKDRIAGRHPDPGERGR